MGEDIVATQLVLPSNHRLRPADLGAAGGCGHTRLAVRRRPRVAIIPTGTELVRLDALDGLDALKPGDIVEYNSIVLGAMAEEWGCVVSRLDPLPDDFDRIRAATAAALADHDLVVINAGSSAGSEDFTARVIHGNVSVRVHGFAFFRETRQARDLSFPHDTAHRRVRIFEGKIKMSRRVTIRVRDFALYPHIGEQVIAFHDGAQVRGQFTDAEDGGTKEGELHVAGRLSQIAATFLAQIVNREAKRISRDVQHAIGFAPKTICAALHARQIFAGFGIDANGVAIVDEKWHRNDGAGFERGGFAAAGGGVALERGRSFGDDQINGGGQFHVEWFVFID